jgi:hypothetical protein
MLTAPCLRIPRTGLFNMYVSAGRQPVLRGFPYAISIQEKSMATHMLPTINVSTERQDNWFSGKCSRKYAPCSSPLQEHQLTSSTQGCGERGTWHHDFCLCQQPWVTDTQQWVSMLRPVLTIIINAAYDLYVPGSAGTLS